MKKKYVCSVCGKPCMVECADDGQGEKSVVMECENCHKQTKMYLGDDISYDTLTKVDVSENTINGIVIPDTKNVLCKSSLANLVTLRAAVRTVYFLQEQIDSLELRIERRCEERKRLSHEQKSNENWLKDIGNDRDYSNTYSSYYNKLLEKHRQDYEEEDRQYATKQARKYKFLDKGGVIIVMIVTFLIMFIPLLIYGGGPAVAAPCAFIGAVGLGVAWHYIALWLFILKDFEHLFKERQESTERAYIASAQLKTELQKLIDEDFERRRAPLLEANAKINATFWTFNAQDKVARADIEVLKKALVQEVNYLDGIYRGIIHRSDWENLDYIIYVFVTGRADNLKEALYMVDGQRSAEMIVKSIGMAASYLASNISSSISSIKYEISQSASRISADLSTLQGSIELQNKYCQSKIDKVVDINKNMCDYSHKSYEMMKSINNSLKN